MSAALAGQAFGGVRYIGRFVALAALWHRGEVGAIRLNQQPVGGKLSGHVAQVLALAGQCPAAAYYTKWIIAVDDDVDPTDLNQVLWALSTRCN